MAGFLDRLDCAGFLRDERGSATIEILIWMPFFFFLLFLTVDASMLYWRHGEMWTVARDIARVVARGDLATNQAAIDAYKASHFSQADVAVSATVSGGSAVVVVSRSPSVMTTFSVMEALIGNSLNATVTMRMQ